MTPGNQAAHIRRESNHSAQSDQAPGRGGFNQQAGRGRGSFNQGQYQQQQPGYPATAMPFRANSGRGGMAGGMAPPFQNPGRPMGNPAYQGSPNLATRSPAMPNSMPGTPNMNQAMPMQNQPQQFNGYYAPVTNPSTSTLSANFSNSNRGGTAESWARENKQSSLNQRSSEQSAALGNQSSFSKQLPVEQNNDGLSSVETTPALSVAQANGSDPLLLQRNVPLSGPSEHGTSLPDHISMPPLPTPIPCSAVSNPNASLEGPLDLQRIDLSPEAGGFDQFLTRHQQPNHYGGYPQQGYNDRMQYPMNGGPPMMYGQMQNMGYNIGPPQSPQPGYQQPYVTGQYGQAQPMSRNSSQMSEHRPASSTGMGQPGTPSMAPAVAHGNHTPQPKPSPAPNPSFSRPSRKSAAIVIKRPDGEALDVEKLKAPASPALKDRARTPPVIASTPTPPPKSATPQHARTDSVAAKSTQQIQQEILEKVKAAAAADNERIETQAKADAEAKAANEAKAKEEEKAKLEAKAAEDAKIKEAEEKAAAEKKAKEEEEEMERQIEEMERAEAERERKEAELLEKRAAEKAIADKANAEKAKLLAEENDRKLKEQEREMERLEDEKEAKRLAAAQAAAKPEVKTVKPEAKEVAPNTPATLASKLSSLTLGTDSGASTPGSDDSMGPPAKASNEKRSKPAALNLAPLNTKPIEPPQPSAALQSLKSARFLTVLNSSIYPADIRSPNPALNTAVTTKGKSFKYDKEFLLQFQKVFVEKPSMEFESQIKALIGDPTEPGSARSTTRGGSGMGARGNSNRASGNFAMGQFGAGGAIVGKMLPPGTTSDQRFAMSSGSLPRPAPHPMASFTRATGGFAGGPSMSRSGSQMGNNAPNSPRQASRSQRQGSKRDNYQSGGNSKQDAQHAKTMPLTAGMDLKPIQVTATGWKPRSINTSQSATGAAGPAPGASGAPGHMEPEMVQRKVKAALNKMTPEKFDKISEQVLVIAQQSKDEADGRTLRQVIQLTFEKATDEAHWASMYAKFCKRMLETMSPDIKDESILDKNGNIVSGGNLFRKYLLNRCQEEFERGWKMDLGDKPEGERGEEKTEEAAMLSDEYYIAAAAKRRGLGLVQFIGELYKLSMLTERIMHECVKKLVDYTGIPDEAEIESLTKLLKTIGLNLDSTEKGKPMMDVYFARIQGMVDTPDLPSRLRFMLMDIIDLRRNHWKSKEANKGPKTLDEVRLEVSS